MKRTPLKRETPLRARKPMRRKPPRRLRSERNDTPYRAAVCAMPCAARDISACDGEVEPAHATLSLNEKGTALKVDDRQCIPLCHKHHDELDGRRQPRFTDGWSKDRRFGWCRKAVAETRERATVRWYSEAA